MTELENLVPPGRLALLPLCNIFLVVFNLIPAFPDGRLDGCCGRSSPCGSAMSMQPGSQPALGREQPFSSRSQGLFSNPMLIVIGLFIYLVGYGRGPARLLLRRDALAFRSAP